MMQSREFPFRQALILGLGRSGLASAHLLDHFGVKIRVYDQNPHIDQLPDHWVKYLGQATIPENAWAGVDLLVLSPGLPPKTALAQQQLYAPHATIHGEMSLALNLIEQHWPTIPTTMVTGTNGKSTVTELIGELLRSGKQSPWVGGNLGTPLSDFVLSLAKNECSPPGALVLECSSYQLETYTGNPCDVATVLNISPDHLDRYASIDHYAQTKARIFQGLVRRNGLALLDADDSFTPQIQPYASTRCTQIGTTTGPQLLYHGNELTLYLNDQECYPRSLLRPAGRHNAKNALFALATARAMGVHPDACRQGLANFQGLPHRMQFVAEVNQIAFYNDSKATNVAGVLAGLDGFERPFVLIAGGRAKEGDSLDALQAVLRQFSAGLVTLGESAKRFQNMAKGIVPVKHAKDMQQAVAIAHQMAQPGQAVVLSPACASWDMFQSYADRGNQFCEAVQSLSSNKSFRQPKADDHSKISS